MTANSWKNLPQEPQFNKQKLKRLIICYAIVCIFLIIFSFLGWILLKTINSSTQRLEQFQFTSDGVLTEDWFKTVISLPWNEQLMKINLKDLKQKILQYSQVESVEVIREFPSCIKVEIHEKKACAKILLLNNGKRKLFLISSKGEIFSPIAYTRSMLTILPNFSGLHKGLFANKKLIHFDAIANFIKILQTEAPDVYEYMQSISLKHFDPALDKNWWILEIHLKGGLIVVMPIINLSEALQKWKLIFNNLSLQQKASLKKIDLSLSHPILTF